MSAVTIGYMSLELELPWERDKLQEEKFQRLLKSALVLLLILFLVIPWLPVFSPEYEEPEKKLVRTEVILEPPVVENKPAPKPKKKVEPPPAKPAMTKAPKPKSRSAANSLAALSSQLSGLTSAVDVKRMKRKNVSDNKLGKVTRSSRTVLGEKNLTRRSNSAQLDKAVMTSQVVALASHQATSVNSPVGSGTGGPINQRSYSSGMESRRDMESIRRTFERQKGNVYTLYTKALRNHPELSGKFMFNLVIESDGTVSNLRLVNSELGMDDLERRILARIKTINFGVADASPTPVQYKFVFLPS